MLVNTSNDWQKIYPEIKILDPDGWDRKNFNYSWYEELITFEEYNNRLVYSTCIGLQHFPLKRKEVEVVPEVKYVLIDGEQVCNCGVKKSEHQYRHPFIPQILKDG